jgi:hypothetical protein
MDTALQAQLTQIQQQLAKLAQQSASRHEALQQQVVQSASDRSELKHQLSVLAQLITASQPMLDTAAVPTSASTCFESCDSRQSGAFKRAHLTDDRTSSLNEDVILNEVFNYVGIKDYIYAAGVSRKWRVRYLKLCYSKATSKEQKDKLSTSFKNAAMTAARLQWAFDSGLTVADLQKHQRASASALACTSLEPITVLTLARTYGLQWTRDYTLEAAVRNDVQLLQWLLRCGCDCSAASVTYWAQQQHNNLDMLKCCESAGLLCDDLKAHMLVRAGIDGQLNILQWLRDMYTAWPVMLYEAYDNCWTVPAIQWALANGCSWSGWRCQHAKAANFNCAVNGLTAGDHNDDACTAAHCMKRKAAVLFAWAHEHGCPCSCGDPSSPVEHHDSGDSDNDSDDSSVNDG